MMKFLMKTLSKRKVSYNISSEYNETWSIVSERRFHIYIFFSLNIENTYDR